MHTNNTTLSRKKRPHSDSDASSESNKVPRIQTSAISKAQIANAAFQAAQAAHKSVPTLNVFDLGNSFAKVIEASLTISTSQTDEQSQTLPVTTLKAPPVATLQAPPTLFRYADIRNTDYIMEKGGRGNHHFGNQQLNAFIKGFHSTYKGLAKFQKKQFVSNILKKYEEEKGPIKVFQAVKSSNGKYSGLYQEINKENALFKDILKQKFRTITKKQKLQAQAMTIPTPQHQAQPDT